MSVCITLCITLHYNALIADDFVINVLKRLQILCVGSLTTWLIGMDALVVCMDVLQRAKTYFITFINNRAKKMLVFDYGVID